MSALITINIKLTVNTVNTVMYCLVQVNIKVWIRGQSFILMVIKADITVKVL